MGRCGCIAQGHLRGNCGQHHGGLACWLGRQSKIGSGREVGYRHVVGKIPLHTAFKELLGRPRLGDHLGAPGSTSCRIEAGQVRNQWEWLAVDFVAKIVASDKHRNDHPFPVGYRGATRSTIEFMTLVTADRLENMMSFFVCRMENQILSTNIAMEIRQTQLLDFPTAARSKHAYFAGR
jgi:hypothetical protein